MSKGATGTSVTFADMSDMGDTSKSVTFAGFDGPLEGVDQMQREDRIGLVVDQLLGGGGADPAQLKRDFMLTVRALPGWLSALSVP